MSFLAEFEEHNKDIGHSDLWKTLKNKAEKECLPLDFIEAVATICEKGIVLSKDIIRFFPNYTLHDITHISNVCRWMINLLGGKKNRLSATEAALLLMSACCHDIGMSVSIDQEKELKSTPQSDEWIEYFKKNLKDEEEYKTAGEITTQILRNYIRTTHHKRISKQLGSVKWPEALSKQGIQKKNLVNLCESHCESLANVDNPHSCDYDLRFCAVLLRLADILDFDSTRAPDTLFYHLGLHSPEDYEHSISQMEWMKNRSGGFGRIHDNAIDFTASFSSLQLEIQIQDYLKWVKAEFSSCSDCLTQYAGKWNNFNLPHKILADNIERYGYKFGDFHLTMDQDRVLELLTGRNLYSDPGVFVRELLQNSIDAIIARHKFDRYFDKETGKITIHTWRDNDGFDWFRIQDNGTGMDENIITKYFLKVGRSYYTSDDYQADKRHYGLEKEDSPTSRFGIGILSCFMSDPNNNRLEVSTKKYTHDPNTPNPAIRLNVDGLHGYYYFAQAQEQNDHDAYFKPMHSPDANNVGYRTDIGTTICVRTNIYKLSNYLSFKEIIDKYVQFPEVTIEYFWPGGQKFYPSKHSLTQAIDIILAKHQQPSAPYIVKYQLPDKFLQQIEEHLIAVLWKQKPVIQLKYIPLNELSVSDDLSGIAIYAELNLSGLIQIPTYYYHFKPHFHYIHCTIKNDPHTETIHFQFTADYNGSASLGKLLTSFNPRFRKNPLAYYLGKHKLKYITFKNLFLHTVSRQFKTTPEAVKELAKKVDQLYNSSEQPYSLILSYSDFYNLFPKDEADLLRLVFSSISYTHNQGQYDNQLTLVSYNGILADTSNLLGNPASHIGSILLLKGEDYYPEVNIARSIISSFPLNATLDLEQINRRLSVISNEKQIISKPSFSKKYLFLTETDYLQFIDENPIWESNLMNSKTSFNEIKQHITSFEQKNLTNRKKSSPPPLYYVSWRYRFRTKPIISKQHINRLHTEIPIDYSRLDNILFLVLIKKYFSVFISDSNGFLLQKRKEHIQALDFPAQMFFHFLPDVTFLVKRIESTNMYNISHPFSQWLVANQKLLQKNLSGTYYNLIEKMILCDNPSEIKEFINSMLLQIKTLGLIAIDDSLFLTDSDFLFDSEEDDD